MLAEPREVRVEGARVRLVREIREGTVEVDIAAANEVKRLGLIADSEQ